MVKNHIKLERNCQQIPDKTQELINNGVTEIIFDFQPNNLPLNDILSFLQKGVVIANDHGVKFTIKNIPFCLLPEYTEKITNDQLADQKYKNSQCQDCNLDKKCSGLWSDFPNENLHPINKIKNNKENEKIKIGLIKLKKHKNIKITIKQRKEIFNNIQLLYILKYLEKNDYVFHASKNHYNILKPHQASGAWKHGNLKAVYATEHPADAIFYSLHVPQKLTKTSFSTIYTTQKTFKKLNIFFATKDIINNFNNGFIHVLQKKDFQYINDELINKNKITPEFIFETKPSDFNEHINQVPFIETTYNPDKLFTEQEREIIRQFLFTFKKVKTTFHGFDHMYRVSEISFDLALNECPDSANDVFLAACLHDIAKDTDEPDKTHSLKGVFIAKKILSKYWKNANLPIILKSIARHEKPEPTNNKVIGCLLDADRLDLLRLDITPRIEYFSTESGKRALNKILNRYEEPGIYTQWTKVFKEILTKNQINDF